MTKCNHKLDKNNKYCIICGMKVVGGSFREATPEEKKEWENNPAKFIADTIDQPEPIQNEDNEEHLEKEVIKEMITPMQKEENGIDMGINSICNVCNRRYCICPERQIDKSWKQNEEKGEEYPCNIGKCPRHRGIMTNYSKPCTCDDIKKTEKIKLVKCDRCGQIKPLGKILEYPINLDNGMNYRTGKGLCIECSKDVYGLTPSQNEANYCDSRTLEEIANEPKSITTTSTPSQVEEWKEKFDKLMHIFYTRPLNIQEADKNYDTVKQFITSLLQEQGEKKDREWREKISKDIVLLNKQEEELQEQFLHKDAIAQLESLLK